MATAVADVAAARRDYMDESGGRYVHVIADGGDGPVRRHRQGGRLRRGRRHARRRPGARDRGARAAATTGAPRRTTRRCRAASGSHVGTAGSLEEILLGPAPRRRRHDQPRRRPAPGDGDDRVLRPQGVPAGRGRRLPVPAQLSPFGEHYGDPSRRHQGRTHQHRVGRPGRRAPLAPDSRTSCQHSVDVGPAAARSSASPCSPSPPCGGGSSASSSASRLREQLGLGCGVGRWRGGRWRGEQGRRTGQAGALVDREQGHPHDRHRRVVRAERVRGHRRQDRRSVSTPTSQGARPGAGPAR